MEDQEPIVDIDGCDAKNPLAAVDYVEDLYEFYRNMEVQYILPLLIYKSFSSGA